MKGLRDIRRSVGSLFALCCFVLASCGGGGGQNNDDSAANPVPSSPKPQQTLNSDSGLTSLVYVSLHLKINDWVWDAKNQAIHMAVAADSGNYASSIISVEPTTGVIRARRPVTPEPTALAVSANGQFVYAGFDGGIVRVHAESLSPDITFGVLKDLIATQIAVSPTNARTIAVAGSVKFNNVSTGRIYVYDDAVQRSGIADATTSSPDKSFSVSVLPSGIFWSEDGSALYAANKSSRATFLEFSVSAAGLSLQRRHLWPASAGRKYGPLIYADTGDVLDVDQAIIVGSFATTNPDSPQPRTEHLELGKAFAELPHYASGTSVQDGYALTSFDTTTYAPLDSMSGIGAAAQKKMISWGIDGIAWMDNSNVFIASGTFVQSGGVPTKPAEPKVLVSGTVSGASGSLTYKILDFNAQDAAVDACNKLYFVTGPSSYRPNSLVEFDDDALLTKRSAFAASQSAEISDAPDVEINLAVSDDCSTAYVTSGVSNAVVRIGTAQLTRERVIPLSVQFVTDSGADQLARASSIAVVPGQPKSFAVAKHALRDSSINFEIVESIVDDAVERPSTGHADDGGYNGLIFGKNSNTLYTNAIGVFEVLQVDTSGIAPTWTLIDDLNLPGFYQSGKGIRFDSQNGRLYSPGGSVVDTQTNQKLGVLDPQYEGAFPTKLNAIAVATSGKVFLVYPYAFAPGKTAYELAIFPLGSFTPSSKAEIVTDDKDLRVHGQPLRLVRSGPQRLALVTENGNVILLQGPMLAD